MTKHIRGGARGILPTSRRHTSASSEWRKPIPEERDRIQSEVLVGAVGVILAVEAVLEILQLHGSGPLPPWFWGACGISSGFALVVWLIRSATAPAAAMGGLVCLHVLLRQQMGGAWEATAMPSLLALFLLTFAATRFGRARKEAMGTAEERRGRRASQVLANLGVAGMLAAGGAAGSFASAAMLAACVAALAEATADTVSSEMGQALAGTRWGGTTLLITTGKPVAAGTDGGVSVAGTAFGALAAAVVVLLSPFAHTTGPALGIFAAACAGLIFDSVLGATLERRGWLGNDLVNFTSTVFAAAVAWGALRLL
jgi:uncharacterized protein (TIGR00297 family)